MPVGGGIISLPPFGVGGGGNEEFPEIGSGQSGPAGVDAHIEYNSVIMNIRRNVDSFMILSIDGLHDADIRDAREVNPGDDGETFFNAYYGGRTIVLNGRIRAGNLAKMRDMQQVLRLAFADLKNENPLIFHNQTPETTFQINCKKHQPLVMGEAQNNWQLERDFQVSLRASNPRFLSLLADVVSINPNATANIIHKGNYNAQPVFTLSNAMTNPVLDNLRTGQTLRFNGALTGSNFWTIDIAKRRVVDAFGANRFDLVDITSDWIELAPGTNPITLSAGSPAGSAVATVNFRHSYL